MLTSCNSLDKWKVWAIVDKGIKKVIQIYLLETIKISWQSIHLLSCWTKALTFPAPYEHMIMCASSDKISASLSLFPPSHLLTFYTLPPHPSLPLGPLVPQIWTRFDLAVIDCRYVHSSFSGHLSPPWSLESERKRRMKWSQRRRDGFIDARLRPGSMHQSLDHGGWWGLWMSGTSSYRPGAKNLSM